MELKTIDYQLGSVLDLPTQIFSKTFFGLLTLSLLEAIFIWIVVFTIMGLIEENILANESLITSGDWLEGGNFSFSQYFVEPFNFSYLAFIVGFFLLWIVVHIATYRFIHAKAHGKNYSILDGVKAAISMEYFKQLGLYATYVLLLASTGVLIFVGFQGPPVVLYVMLIPIVLAGYGIFVRLILAPVIIPVEEVGPFEAIKTSWKYTRGKYWKTLLYIILFSISINMIVSMVLTPITLIILLLSMDYSFFKDLLMNLFSDNNFSLTEQEMFSLGTRLLHSLKLAIPWILSLEFILEFTLLPLGIYSIYIHLRKSFSSAG